MADFLINVIVNTDGATRGVQNVDRSLTSIERSLNRVQNLIGAVFAFQAVGAGIRAITNLADSLSNAQNRVRSLSIEGQALDGVINGLFGVANRTRQEFTTTAEVFTRTAASLRVLGLGADEALQLTESLNQAVALSGSTSAEASNALIQFSQGLASGTLRGDELRSVLEQIPVVADVIARQLGVTRNELRLLAADGTITPQVIVEAFRNARVELEERFAKLIPTIAQSFVVLRNRVIEVGGGFLQSSGASEAFSRTILSIADNIETVIRVIAALATGLIGLPGLFLAVRVGIVGVAAAIAANPFGALVLGISTAIGFLTTFADQIRITNDGVATLADVAIVAFGRLRDGIAAAFNTIAGFINQFIPNLNLINISFEDVARGSAAALDALVALFAAGIAAIQQVVGNIGPVLQDAFILGFNAAIQAVEGGINFIIDGIAALPGALFDTARDAILGFAQVFDIGFDEIVGFVASIPGRIADALTGLFTTGQQAGVSLIQGIDDAIDVQVDPLAGDIQVKLGRLENPASGALQQVGQVAGDQFAQTLSQAPVSGALEGVLEDARTQGVARAQTVGNDIGEGLGTAIFGGLNVAIARERQAFVAALDGLQASVTDFIGITEQQFENFAANLSTILGNADLAGAFNQALTSLAQLIGTVRSDLANALGGVFAILNELGFSFEETFGTRATQVIRILGAVTSEQFQSILNVGQSVFNTLLPLISGLVPAFSGAAAAAGAFGTAAASAGAAAAAAFAPVLIVIVGVSALVLAAAAIFGVFGDEVQKVALILAVVFAPFLLSVPIIIQAVRFLRDVFSDLGNVASAVGRVLAIIFAPIIIPIQAIIAAIRFLIAAFQDLGNVGSAAGRLLAVVLAPIVVPIRLIITAVQFLINLFTNLGNVGGTVSRLLAVVLAPIVIPIRLIITAIEALIGVFNNLGNIGRAVTAALSAALNGFLAVGRAVFAGFLAAGTAAFNALQAAGSAALNALQAAGAAAFNALQAAGSAALNALQAALNALQAAGAAAFNALQAAGAAAFNALQAAGAAAFNAISAGVQGLVGVFSGVFNTILSAGTAAFNGLVGVAQGAFNAIAGAAQSIAGTIGNVIGGAIGAAKGAIGSIGGSIGKIGSSIGKKIGGGIKKIGSAFGFAQGGVITGPVALDGPGVGGKAFRRGGVLPGTTGLSNPLNVTGTRQLGLAGEAGPEAIMPLTRTSGGLGVRATLPEGLLQSLQSANDNGGSGGEMTVNKIVIISTSSERIEDLEKEVRNLDASVETRSEVRLAEILSGVG